ncbi:acyl-CoA desaturase [Candidatus Thalassolituus haligoni]|jgi:stearoyl-CoA desaturase (delta-9 desaturase)|uniref:acyl-CoA desaturase n=1 Tax=Candidatus Thalassolituus haligoni TaxID=3100113 RepID=UPI003514F79A|tara:strand:+ start:13810 stop:14991 length:1182 start_codon:yes stop_codon:yes gene_type:complete
MSQNDQAQSAAEQRKNNKKPPIYWTPTIMFSVSTLGVLTLVPWYGFTHGYDTSAWVAYVVITWLTGMAITGGYHRLWSHNAYDAHWALRIWYALWGASALQNTVLEWCSGHRKHHRHVDDVDQDPYSAKRGLWFSHIGWMLREWPAGKTDYANVKNLLKDPIVMWQDKYYVWIVLAMNVGLPVALGLVFGDVWGMLLLAGLLRLFTTHHVTFFINSIAHKWGSQPYTDENTARDNPFFAFLTHGEGYHNYHHIFQNDYRNGIRWYHWDPTKWFIQACSWVGLASNLRTVSNFKIQRAKIQMQFKRAKEELALRQLKEADHQRWSEVLEKEYAQFKAMLNDWTSLQGERYSNTRQSLACRWEKAAIRTRYQELEYALRMQHKRMQLLMVELAPA